MIVSLELILEDLYRRARENPGIPQQSTLEDGLRIDLLVHQGETQLQISRADEFPMVDEFNNILHHWWEMLETPTPQPVAHSGRKFLSAGWLRSTQSLSA
jgi:hypothetical protein